jgi:Putative metal-binding motif
MTNKRNSILSALFSFASVLALTACIDPIIIGGNGNGGSAGAGGNNGACMTDADCGPGQTCENGVCSGANPMTCNGVPSPLSCTQTGCAPGQMCVMDPDPNACYPSSCGCDAATGLWVCTADCGQGGYCVPSAPCGPNAECPPNSVCDASGVCVPVCVPSPEVCNAVDDDCDGVVDEQEDPAIPLCANGALCVMGQCGGGGLICMADADCPPNQVCLNGMCSGNGPTCTQEVCNGIDDDCNGSVDDGAGAVCADGSMCVMGQCGSNPQQCGDPGTPPCPPGQVCSPNGVCVPGCNASPEVCNGLDDDCDGVIDDTAAGTTLCPNGGVCVNGQCNGGVVQCGPNAPCPAGQMCSPNGVCVPGGGVCNPVPEVCNGLDDDCDGVVDDATPGTTLCSNGICLNGGCKIPCQANQQCPAGTMCVNGICN